MTLKKLNDMIEAKFEYMKKHPEDVGVQDYILLRDEHFEFCEEKLEKIAQLEEPNNIYHCYSFKGMKIYLLTNKEANV